MLYHAKIVSFTKQTIDRLLNSSATNVADIANFKMWLSIQYLLGTQFFDDSLVTDRYRLEGEIQRTHDIHTN